MRLDTELVIRKLYATRAKAAAAIDAGLVLVNGVPAKKPSQNILPTDKTEAGALPYLSGRGSLKLAKALDEFNVDPAGFVCLDVGASTGGFTEVLLSHNAQKVIAVDVGTGQMVPELKKNPRVLSLENTDIRALAPILRPDLIVVDVSFVSLCNIMESLANWGAPKIIALIKPQFEVQRAKAAKSHGIIKSEADRQSAIASVKAYFEKFGYKNVGLTESPIKGGSGNVEYLALFVTD